MTNVFLFIFLFVPVLIFFASGLINLNPKLRAWSIEYNNKANGIKTEITEMTNKSARNFGIFMMILCVISFIFWILFLFKIHTFVTPFDIY